jgi:geranylgeranyl diphosphate synthase type II
MSRSGPSDLFAPVTTINEYLETTLQDVRPPLLQEAARYAVLQGGKRMRPLLCWYCCEAAGSPGKASLPAGAAVELVHAFSLVHDDLPALDNDDLRRGQPTLHKHAGEAMAILAGDALLTLAFRHLGKERPELVSLLALCTERMIGGQVLDTLGGFPQEMPDRERVHAVHTDKTGALLQFACVAGYRLGASTRDEEGEKSILRYAECIGLMFQIVDDLIDVTQTDEDAGKRTAKDAAAGKLTYPGVFGIEESRMEVERLRAEAVASVARFGDHAEPLRTLAEYLATRTK